MLAPQQLDSPYRLGHVAKHYARALELARSGHVFCAGIELGAARSLLHRCELSVPARRRADQLDELVCNACLYAETQLRARGRR